MNYFEQVVAEVRQELPGITDTQARMYALLVLVMGPGVSAEHVHHAWAAAEPNPDHPCLVPWADLSVEEKRKDKPYARALQRVAAGKRRTSTRRHLPPETINALVEAYNHGQSLNDLAVAHSMSRTTARQVLAHAGVQIRPRGGPRKADRRSAVDQVDQVHPERGQPGSELVPAARRPQEPPVEHAAQPVAADLDPPPPVGGDEDLHDVGHDTTVDPRTGR